MLFGYCVIDVTFHEKYTRTKSTIVFFSALLENCIATQSVSRLKILYIEQITLSSAIDDEFIQIFILFLSKNALPQYWSGGRLNEDICSCLLSVS